MLMKTPEQIAREQIDKRLEQSGWIIQDMKKVNPMASLGVAVREYPTSTGPVDYALFVFGKPVGVVEAKKDDLGESITTVESQNLRYANSTFKYISSRALPTISTLSVVPARFFLSIARKHCSAG